MLNRLEKGELTFLIKDIEKCYINSNSTQKIITDRDTKDNIIQKYPNTNVFWINLKNGQKICIYDRDVHSKEEPFSDSISKFRNRNIKTKTALNQASYSIFDKNGYFTLKINKEKEEEEEKEKGDSILFEDVYNKLKKENNIC